MSRLSGAWPSTAPICRVRYATTACRRAAPSSAGAHSADTDADADADDGDGDGDGDNDEAEADTATASHAAAAASRAGPCVRSAGSGAPGRARADSARAIARSGVQSASPFATTTYAASDASARWNASMPAAVSIGASAKARSKCAATSDSRPMPPSRHSGHAIDSTRARRSPPICARKPASASRNALAAP